MHDLQLVVDIFNVVAVTAEPIDWAMKAQLADASTGVEMGTLT